MWVSRFYGQGSGVEGCPYAAAPAVATPYLLASPGRASV
jgi:hypothetical protein